MKKGQRVRHYELGVWRRGTFQGMSTVGTLGYVLFDDCLPGATGPGDGAAELVRLDEIEVQSEDANG